MIFDDGPTHNQLEPREERFHIRTEKLERTCTSVVDNVRYGTGFWITPGQRIRDDKLHDISYIMSNQIAGDSSWQLTPYWLRKANGHWHLKIR